MEDHQNRYQEPKEEEKKNKSQSIHNLYSKVNIPIKTLDRIIIVLIAALVIAIVIGLKNRGYTIDFDSQGGTYVESQKKMYGETVDHVVPTREGYRFEGWSLFPECSSFYDENSEVNGSFRLYACWAVK